MEEDIYILDPMPCIPKELKGVYTNNLFKFKYAALSVDMVPPRVQLGKDTVLGQPG